MLKVEEVTINDRTYQISQLPLGKARPLLVRLTNLVGPAIGEALAGAEGDKLSDISLAGLGNAVRTLASQLRDDDLGAIQNALFEYVKWQNDNGDWVPLKPIADNHFAGELGLLFKVIGAALKVNFASFLAEIGLGEMFAQSQTLSRTSQPLAH